MSDDLTHPPLLQVPTPPNPDTVKLIQEFFQSVANYWKLKDPMWYTKDFAFHRAIWMTCNDLIKNTDYDPLIGTRVAEVSFNQPKVKINLQHMWFYGASLVVYHIISAHKGEYVLSHAIGVAKEFAQYWDNDYDTEVHFFDYVETIVLHSCGNEQVNIPCIRAMCDICEINLSDICVLLDNINTKH